MSEGAIADDLIEHGLDHLKVAVLHGLARHGLPAALKFVAVHGAASAERTDFLPVGTLLAELKQQVLQFVDVELKVARAVIGDRLVRHQREEHVEPKSCGAQRRRVGAGALPPFEVLGGGDAEERRPGGVQGRRRVGTRDRLGFWFSRLRRLRLWQDRTLRRRGGRVLDPRLGLVDAFAQAPAPQDLDAENVGVVDDQRRGQVPFRQFAFDLDELLPEREPAQILRRGARRRRGQAVGPRLEKKS